jgi:hypothetical protein
MATKQQIAQAKARAGGNNPIKVTNAGLKKLGSAALLAASFTPAGRVIKTASTASKMAKTADARRKFDAATERRILDTQVKKSVKVLPRKTAPKTDLSNRGAKPSRAQRSERAQDYQFDRSLGKYYSNQDRIAGTSPNELAKGSRGQGVKSARKTAAIKKEAKPVVKINSQRNLKAK